MVATSKPLIIKPRPVLKGPRHSQDSLELLFGRYLIFHEGSDHRQASAMPSCLIVGWLLLTVEWLVWLLPLESSWDQRYGNYGQLNLVCSSKYAGLDLTTLYHVTSNPREEIAITETDRSNPDFFYCSLFFTSRSSTCWCMRMYYKPTETWY